MKLTIAIPTFNGAPRLAKVLEHLQAQELAGEWVGADTWEILVVDNNSKDDTAAVVKQLQANWAKSPQGKQVPFRYCFEPNVGSPNARKRAINEANGTWVGFIDDDNWPDPHWVASAIEFTMAHPCLGAFGSRIKAVYEVEPPPQFDCIEPFLAIRDHGSSHQFDPEHLQLPPGAGLVVHRQRWLDSIPTATGMVGAKGGIRVSGSDYAELLYMHRLGHGIAYNSAMVIQHAISARRLERSYLLPLAYSIGISTCQLRFINAQGIGRYLIAVRTCIGGLRRMLYQLWRHGPGLREDLKLMFYFCFFLGGTLSPLLALAPSLSRWLSFRSLQALTHKLWPVSTSVNMFIAPTETSPEPFNQS